MLSLGSKLNLGVLYKKDVYHHPLFFAELAEARTPQHVRREITLIGVRLYRVFAVVRLPLYYSSSSCATAVGSVLIICKLEFQPG